jgi:hypothetical protein
MKYFVQTKINLKEFNRLHNIVYNLKLNINAYKACIHFFHHSL